MSLQAVLNLCHLVRVDEYTTFVGSLKRHLSLVLITTNTLTCLLVIKNAAYLFVHMCMAACMDIMKFYWHNYC